MKRIRRFVSDYFGFSPKETRGFIILLALICIVLSVPFFLDLFLTNSTLPSEPKTAKLDSIIALLEETSSPPVSEKIVKEIKLFKFDPNNISREEWLQLGLTERTVTTILNYKGKGGVFKIRSDLKKIYGLKQEQYEVLYPYIALPETFSSLKPSQSVFERKRVYDTQVKLAKYETQFDINKADSLQLIALKGIGEKLSKRIINFRDKLGGFVNKQQYKEIYGLDTTVLKILDQKSFVEEDFKPKKININLATVDELKSHPYIKSKLATVLVSYRAQHGKYGTLNELKNIKILSEKDFDRLIPYLEL